jgi:DNA-binding transcriptional ArsR family regulator
MEKRQSLLRYDAAMRGAGAAEPDRRPATAAEHRALAHPLRLRILRLCLDEERTNKELAEALGRDPGTVLHHVRMLVDGGFLLAGEPRRGTRGAREKPYRATRRSWGLDLAAGEGLPSATVAMAEAVTAELREAVGVDGEGAVLRSTRLAVRLRPEDREELLGRLDALVAEALEAEDPDGEPIALHLLAHRRA